MRSSDENVLRFFSQLSNKSVRISGSSGRLTTLFARGLVYDPSLADFTVMDSSGTGSFKIIFRLSDCEFEPSTPSADAKEAWFVKLSSDDWLKIELLEAAALKRE